MNGRAIVALAVAAGVTVAVGGCQRNADKQPEATRTIKVNPTAPRPGSAAPPMRAPQIKPPLAVAQPPADAEQISGIEGAPQGTIYIKRLVAGAGANPGRNDTVRLNFTGWRTSGETFMSTTVRKRPVEQSLARLAPGFAAAVASMKKGERAMMWIPPALGYLGPPTDTPETTVYEVELVDFEAAPTTPPDVSTPPANGARTASGAVHVTVKRGTGKDRPRFHDLVTMHYSAWSSSGRLFDSSELTKQPKQTFVFREPPGLEEVLTTMVVGERKRVWLPAGQIEMLPTTPAGALCYEIELLSLRAMHAPPAVPRDVAAPPTGAQKTAQGVFYKVLHPGTGTAHPGPTDQVKVQYTGWTTDGRLFDSSIVRGEPADLTVNRVIPGWTEGLQTMVTGERTRFWIPVELANKNEPGSPKGMLVFDVELLEIRAAPPPGPPPGAPAPPLGAPPPRAP